MSREIKVNRQSALPLPARGAAAPADARRIHANPSLACDQRKEFDEKQCLPMHKRSQAGQDIDTSQRLALL